ncbi:DUF2249 domain-containing protein [Bacillus sp. FJAT-49711]|uniref:DUF2249 domain-containing protein n=1 Tax=Bacillus sp. FJAT-49711 TaxID=2833585 RepID=UPI001BC931BC|nr:DUF2249 domain-containing protein [Bacillus sp. FJAT-49711]MBS4219525.1 DUF2249 domain-containing protein [Bacillus sp. FJAT-49711]
MEKENRNIVELDVRPHLRKKLEPFQLIMDTVKDLKIDDIFVLHATFKPTPLLGLLKVRGFVNKVEKIEKDHWIVTFVNKKNKHLLDLNESDLMEKTRQTSRRSVDGSPKTHSLDNRGLEPPQPMMRTLAALDRSLPGDEVHIHNDRVPVFLIEELNSLGYPFEVEEQEDGSAKVKIKKV